MPRIVSTRKSLHSSEYHEKRRKEKRFRSGLYLLLFIVIIAIPILLLRWDKFRVANVEVTGGQVVSADEVRGVVDSILEEKYLWILPKDNDVLVPRGAIRQALMTEIPRIMDADVNLLDSKTLNIHIYERSPLALYCREAEEFLEAHDCYFLDEDGFIFGRAPEFSGEVYFVYSREPELPEPLGKQYLEPGVFRKLNLFIWKSEKLGVSPKSFLLTHGEDGEPKKYEILLENLGRIIWDVSDDIELVSVNLESFLKSEPILAEKDFLKRVSYIDLTVPNKVFYKLQE